MGSAFVPPVLDSGLTTRVWRTSDGATVIEDTYNLSMDVDLAGYTCEMCPQPAKTHTLLNDQRTEYTKRCTECARKHQAHKRVRRMSELFTQNRPEGATAVAITLTFGDDDIDKHADLSTLRTETVKRFRKLRERSEWWQRHMKGGISSFECTKRKQGGLHPHLHIVAWTTLRYPYPIEAFRANMEAYGFGMMSTIETAYTKERKRNHKGEFVTFKSYNNPEGAVFYALKYALKDSVLGEKKGRTVTKFGNLYGKKWDATMSAYAKKLHRIQAVENDQPMCWTPTRFNG